MTFQLDTDILNYVIKGISPAFERYGEAVEQGAGFVPSLLVRYQVTRYLKLIGASRLLRNYAELITNWTLVGLDREDWDTAIDLWVARHRAGRPIEDADLLIAVTALKAGAILVTNNVAHFAGLGLTVENWAAPDGNLPDGSPQTPPTPPPSA